LKQDGFEFVTTIFALAPEYITPIQSTEKRPFMPDRPNPKKERNQQSPEDIQVSAISKQTVGAVTGAAIGSVVGPIGAVVGGVVGALAGKAAAGKQPIRKAVSRAPTASKRSLKPHPRKRSRAHVTQKSQAIARYICEKEKIKAVANSTIAQAHVERVADQAEAPEPSHEKALEHLWRCLASLWDPQSCISLVSEIRS
jgi:outer membrane lipoprotein SlyB